MTTYRIYIARARITDRLSALAQECGADVRVTRAQTGTYYLRAERGYRRVTIRVANHADAYGTTDYSCDGVEGTARGARAALLTALGTTEAALRRLRRARRAQRARKLAAERAAWVAAYAVQEGITLEAAERLCPLR